MNSSLPPTQRVKILDDDEPIKTIADAKREAEDKSVNEEVNTFIRQSSGSVEDQLYDLGIRFDNAIPYPQGSPTIHKGGVKITQHADRLLYSWNLCDVNESRHLQNQLVDNVKQHTKLKEVLKDETMLFKDITFSVKDDAFLVQSFSSTSMHPIMFYRRDCMEKSFNCFNIAYQNLKKLHSQYNIFQGSMSTQTIVYDARTQTGAFTDWSRSTRLNNREVRKSADNNRYYLGLMSEQAMKTADMLSLFFSFCDFIGIVTELKFAPIDHIKKKAIELPSKEFEKWKDTAIVLKNERLNTLLLGQFQAPMANYEDLCRDIESVMTGAGVLLSPELNN